jgi:hypothetical protein
MIIVVLLFIFVGWILISMKNRELFLDNLCTKNCNNYNSTCKQKDKSSFAIGSDPTCYTCSSYNDPYAHARLHVPMGEDLYVKDSIDSGCILNADLDDKNNACQALNDDVNAFYKDGKCLTCETPNCKKPCSDLYPNVSTPMVDQNDKCVTCAPNYTLGGDKCVLNPNSTADAKDLCKMANPGIPDNYVLYPDKPVGNCYACSNGSTYNNQTGTCQNACTPSDTVAITKNDLDRRTYCVTCPVGYKWDKSKGSCLDSSGNTQDPISKIPMIMDPIQLNSFNKLLQ